MVLSYVFREFTSSKRPRSSKQSARNRSCNFQTSTKIIHITYCHMIDRLGLFYSCCCCCCFQSPFFCQRVFEILRISTTDQQKSPWIWSAQILICCPNWDVFFPRFFKIQISQPGLKAGRFFPEGFLDVSFLLHDSTPSLFQPLRCQCSEFFYQNITTNITKTGTINHPPKNQFRVC